MLIVLFDCLLSGAFLVWKTGFAKSIYVEKILRASYTLSIQKACILASYYVL